MVAAVDSRARDSVRNALPVGIVADVRLHRESLAAALPRDAGLTVAWAADGLGEALASLARDSARVVVIDVATRDSLRIVSALRALAPKIPIVAFAAHEIDQEIIACAEAGVSGLVPCDATMEDLIAAIICSARGEVRCSPRAVAVLFQRLALFRATKSVAGSPVLTPREGDVLDLLERGLSNKEIAGRLHIQVATVKNHVHSVLEKLGVGTRGEAAARRRDSTLQRQAAHA